MSLQSEDHKETNPQNTGSNYLMGGLTKWLPWTLVGIMGIYLLSNNFGNTQTIVSSLNGFSLLSILLPLICPLMMLFMMFGHRHGSQQDNNSSQNAHSGHGGCCGGHQTDK